MRHVILIALVMGMLGCATVKPPPVAPVVVPVVEAPQTLPREVPETATFVLLDCKDPDGKTVLLEIIVSYPSGATVTIDEKHLYGFSGANEAAKYASAAAKQREVMMACATGT